MKKKILIKETFYYGLFQRNVHDLDDPNPLAVKYSSDFSLEEIMRKTRKECMNLSEGEGFNSIVKVYDWFTENNTAYIITEFIEGVTLDERVATQGRYTWAEFYPKIKPLLISLSALHKKKLIHRDIKPQNIMIRNSNEMGEEFVLIDFGLARSTEKKTLASIAAGFTPGYAPYEQRTFTKTDGTYTDVYSIVATIYYALTGLDPVYDMTENIEGNFPELKNMSEKYGVPQAVVQGMKYGLNPNYKQRCQSIDQLMRFFDRVKLLNELKEAADTTPFSQMNTVRNVNPDNNMRTVLLQRQPEQNNTPVEYAAQQDYYSPEEYDAQQDYYSSEEVYNQESQENYSQEDDSITQFGDENLDEEQQKEYDKKISRADRKIKAAKRKQLTIIRRFFFALFVIGVIAFVIYSVSSWYLHIAKAAIILAVLLTILVIPTIRPLRKRRIVLKLAKFEKDAAFVSAFLQRAVTSYRKGIDQRMWNGKPISEATVHDVYVENGMEDSDKFYVRKAGRKVYMMEWTGSDVKIMPVENNNTSNIKINGNTSIQVLAEATANVESKQKNNKT